MEEKFLENAINSDEQLFIVAEVDGATIGTLGFGAYGNWKGI